MEPEIIPQDAEAIQQLLESMGVADYDPRIVEQLMEFTYRYTAEVLQDAESVASSSAAPQKEVSAQDVMLAIQSRAQYSFVPPPPLQLILSLAEFRNGEKLPELKPRHGLRIPPEGECLLNPNFQLQPTNEPPFLPAQEIDIVTRQARELSSNVVQKRHVVSINTPGEGWKPGEDRQAETWPGQQVVAEKDQPTEEI